MRIYGLEEFSDRVFFPFRASQAPVTIDFELHVHEFVEIVYVKSGEGVHLFEGESCRVSEGDLFIVPPGVAHGYRRINGATFVVHNIIFDPAYLEKELNAMSAMPSFLDFYYVEPFLRQTAGFKPRLNLKTAERLEVIRMLDEFVAEDGQRAKGFELYIKAGLLRLFIYLSRCYERLDHSPMSDKEDEAAAIRKVGELIARHYAEPFSLQQLSRLCGMSQTAFTDKFKRHMGRTFLEYRNDIRIRVACSLLRESDGKIIAIARDTGFDDLSFFNKTFKKLVGVSPGQYRKAHKAGSEEAEESGREA